MNSQIRPEINKESLELENGEVTGVIYFEDGGFYFPSKEWSDSVNTLLYWWLVAISSLRQKDKDVAELLFSEGAYLLRLSCKQNNVWKVDFISENNPEVKEVIVRTYQVDSQIIINEILRIIEEFTEIVDEFKWKPKYLEQIIDLSIKLKPTGLP